MVGILEDDKGILNMKKLKVALICYITNPRIQSNLKFRINLVEKIARKLKKKTCDISKLAEECNVFIENAIHEFEKYTDEVELHIISPHGWLKNKKENFVEDGIFYHFFQNESQLFRNRLLIHFFQSKQFSLYKNNRKQINRLVKQLQPDIVYMTGAENPFYSLSLLDIPKTIPTVVHLQTLMNDPEFEKNYPISHQSYVYRASNELRILQHANYIATTVTKYRNIIKEELVPNAIFLSMKLAVGEKIIKNNNIKKDYDFVYFAANINKAFDLALEGFAVAHNSIKNIKLLVIGDYDFDFKNKIDLRINELSLQEAITFTGRLPSHNDVLKEIQRAKYALLPLKIDITSGTIRESMACGLPVITTITEKGTTLLNSSRETVLLSEIGNHKALANNMLLLMNNPNLVNTLIENGKKLLQEQYENENAVRHQIDCLKAAVQNFTEKTPIKQEFLF